MIAMYQRRTYPCSAGFSLVELVMVIVIVGIVAAATGMFIIRPIQGYVDLSRRAALVDAAESALRRMARDIRVALPNSLRTVPVGAGYALEILPTLDGGRYSIAAGDPLDFTLVDPSFDILGCFHNFNFTIPALPAAFSTTSHRLVINNLGTTGNDNAYLSSGALGVITPAGATISYSVSPGTNVCGAVSNVHHIAITGGYQFKSPGSPRQRLFVIDTNEAPVTYLCDPAARTLTRYAGYTFTDPPPTNPGAAPLNTVPATRTGLVANHVTQCGVTTTTPQVQQRGLVTLALTLSDQGETIQLIHQVQLDNSR